MFRDCLGFTRFLETIDKGAWPVDNSISLQDWVDVSMTANACDVTISLNSTHVATINHLEIRPILGGDVNTGSVAFGGPEGWVATYRTLLVRDPHGNLLYQNDLLPASKERTLADFQVGTNAVACTIDGAKRDRACFGGDLFVTGRAIGYSVMNMEAVAGTIQLLTSHQTSDGYLGNLCPVQAPMHTGDKPPPTYAFYSLTYALLLVVAIKDYWLHTSDNAMVTKTFPALERLQQFVEKFVNSQGLVEAPPPLSMHWLPLGGPVLGVLGGINLAYYASLDAMRIMSTNKIQQAQFADRADQLRKRMLTHLWNDRTGVFRLSNISSQEGLCQDINAYAMSLDVTPKHQQDLCNLAGPDSRSLQPAFQNLGHWDASKVVSPYATGFAVEALFKRGWGERGVGLIERVWGVMADRSNPNFSGGHWEALTPDGKPHGHDTSLVHAWSTWPVFLLPQYLAGLEPLEPGWTSFRMKPIPSKVEYVEYELETRMGRIEIEVRWDLAGIAGQVTLSLPVGTKAIIEPPEGFTTKEPTVIISGSSKSTIHFSTRQKTSISPESESQASLSKEPQLLVMGEVEREGKKPTHWSCKGVLHRLSKLLKS